MSTFQGKISKIFAGSTGPGGTVILIEYVPAILAENSDILLYFPRLTT
jgi:hypothetical protein